MRTVVIGPGFDLSATIRTAVDAGAILLIDDPKYGKRGKVCFDTTDVIEVKSVSPTITAVRFGHRFRQKHHARFL